MSALETLFDRLFPTAVAPDALARRGARALAELLASERYGGARLVRCAASDDGGEVLFVEVVVALGQRGPVNDIRPAEPFAIVCPSDARVPAACPLRDDFPDVPHFNIAAEGQPRSLCLFEMPGDEALRVATPFVLIERVRHWLRETAHGRLHGDDQPLDPLFAASRHSILLPPGGIAPGEVLAGYRRSADDGSPILLERVGDGRAARGMNILTFACLNLVTSPVPHGRLRALPRNARRLIEIYDELGLDLAASLRDGLTRWVSDSSSGLLRHGCLLLVTTPIERSTGLVDGHATKGFFIGREAGALGVALGAMHKDPDGTFGLLLGRPAVDEAALADMSVEAVDVRVGFDRSLAAVASGYEISEDPSRVALIGAGALGSQIALGAARGGLGAWSIIDPDHFMPHNLARHALGSDHVGRPKAQALAEELTALLGEGAAVGVVEDVRDLNDDAEVLERAAVVIDASASVPCARWLACSSEHLAPTASAFLNPTGTDLVVLREGEGRSPRLDHLEMLYYWQLVCDPSFEGHLRSGGAIMPSGGCRNPSVQLPHTAVATGAAHAVEELFHQLPAKGGTIVTWQRTTDGERRRCFAGEPFVEVELAGWTVAVRASVVEGVATAREASGALETGGILVGGFDRQLRKAWIVAHLDPPPDSERSETGFVRGLVGVHRTIEHIEAATAVNLTYVGEWHTHPPLHQSTPSDDDRLLMKWIGDAVAFSDVPALMMIAGMDGVRLMLGTTGCSVLLPSSE